MVEFGLKLEDNKVSDWSEYYIRYEKLKLILEKCELAVKRYYELSQRDPETSLKTKTSYYNGEPRSMLSGMSLHTLPESRSGSDSSLNITASNHDAVTINSTNNIYTDVRNDENEIIQQQQQQITTTTEYGSVNIINRTIRRAQSHVSDYYSVRYEKLIYTALRSIDTYEDEFGETLVTDIQNVNEFYKSKLNELIQQTLYLRESVQPSKVHESIDTLNDSLLHRRVYSDGYVPAIDEDLPTPLISSTNRKSMAHHHHATSASSPMQIVRKIATWTTQHIAVGGGGGGGGGSSSITRNTGSSGGGSKLPKKLGKESIDAVDPLLTCEKIDDDDDLDAETVKQIRIADSVQRALIEHYRTAKLLHNFAIMNYTGFVKIVKKHGKTVPKEKKGKYDTMIRASNICNEGKDVEILINRMERLYAAWFCDRNVSEARAQMMIKKGDVLEMDWSQLRLGYRMGMSAVLALWVCWDCVWGLLSEGQATIGGRTAFPVFRGCAGLLQLQWCWGISVWVWTRYRVNYIFLFDFDPNLVQNPLTIFNGAVDNTLFYLVCALLYYKAGAHHIPGNFPAGVFPCILILYTLYQLIFPLKLRLPLWKTIFQVITSPMTTPSFFHGYVGDIFTSMVKVFQDLVWAFFFIATGDWYISEDLKESTKHPWAQTSWYTQYLIPTITLLPLWFRFNQCLRRYADTGSRFPHLPNAFKYALSQLVSLFGAFHPLYIMHGRAGSILFQGFWMLLFVTSSLYSFGWDVFMDWGLGSKKDSFLAQRLMYPKRSIYYCIIAIDLVLRFAWVLTLLPPKSGAKFALPAYLTLVSMMLEIFRRTLWGFLRLENEHRSNTAGYRRVDFVPLHFATGHNHGYNDAKRSSGLSVLIEVVGVTVLVLCAAVVSVVAAQHATERALAPDL